MHAKAENRASVQTTTARYVVVTPIRDEEEHIENTIRSVVGQTCPPAQWVIVNDGSTDRTQEIVEKCIADHPWITLVNRGDRGFRAAGSGVVEAFYDGFGALTVDDWEYIVKLDGDLSFAEDYFEKCFDEFRAAPHLGIGGGVIYNKINGQLVLEHHPAFHVRGATKIYRRDCWDAIDGLIKAPGWDTLDEVLANFHRFETRSFPELELFQHRTTGEAAGQLRNWIKNGRACYLVGYHPLFLLARAALRLTKPPYLRGCFGLLWGFWKPWFLRQPRLADPAVVQYLQREQLKRLTGRQSIWR